MPVQEVVRAPEEEDDDGEDEDIDPLADLRRAIAEIRTPDEPAMSFPRPEARTDAVGRPVHKPSDVQGVGGNFAPAQEIQT